ncbi:hypothetical protein HGRIS_014030 [Hohenbuehelia grisea]|uniref:Nodulin-like domain-containing protein n=1 Tax=Hohenbuehelia grisea TaxID=104357 RepID=A0ABR3JS62_9AGAR
MIGLAGNIGVYSSAPLWGKVVDAYGPRIPLASAFVLLFSGYFGIRSIYLRQPVVGQASDATVRALIACNFLTGVGGNAGLNGAGNPVVKSFPDHRRATVTGLVMAGFGLSAFIYSSMARVFFPGDTSSFLLTLAIGTASPMIAGYFMIRIVPLPLAPSGTEEGALIRRVDTQDSSDSTPLLSEEVEPPQPSTDRRPSDSSHEMTGWNLTKNINFWTLFALFSILSGTGIMYINNVGTMSQILYAKSANPYRDVEAAKWQSAQVSTISVVSFLGRVCMGLSPIFFFAAARKTLKYLAFRCIFRLPEEPLGLAKIILSRYCDFFDARVADQRYDCRHGRASMDSKRIAGVRLR